MDRLVSVPIIPRNTALPASKSEVFYTLVDNQDTVEVEAYQGEQPFPELNTLIGAFTVEGLSRVPAGNPIVVRFALDLNGLLHVTATEKHTGLAKTVTMDTRGVHAVNVEEARRNIESLLRTLPSILPEGDEDDRTSDEESPERLLATAKDLRKRGEALLLKNINEDDAREIRERIHESAAAIVIRDWARLTELSDALSDLVFYLED
jgi:molecular chaperone DnaK